MNNELEMDFEPKNSIRVEYFENKFKYFVSITRIPTFSSNFGYFLKFD